LLWNSTIKLDFKAVVVDLELPFKGVCSLMCIFLELHKKGEKVMELGF
jgi:hypothetical protein